MRLGGPLLAMALLAWTLPACGGRDGSDASGAPESGSATDSSTADSGLPVGFDPLTVPEDPTNFVFGVASGDVDDTSAVLWTRYLGTDPLRVRVLETLPGGGFGPTVVDFATGAPNDTGIVKPTATGLTPGTDYAYLFVAQAEDGTFNGRSRIGTFHTAPASGALEPLTFAITGDAKDNYQPYEILSAIAADAPAFFVFNGDTVYADGAVTREEYRDFYEINCFDPHMEELRAATAFYSIWDDHEVANNWDSESVPPAQVDAARAAFLEYHPVREDPANPSRLWRSYTHGDTLELFILDTRGERSPSMGRYVSSEQMQWLKDGLLASTATFKLIVNTVPITDLGPIADAERWTAYPADRSDILDFIDLNALEHVYWLSADIHISLIGVLPEYGGWDLVSGPIGQILVDFAAGFLTLLPTVDYASAEVFNYHLITVDPTAVPPTLTLVIKDAAGSVLHTRVFTD